MLSWLHWIIVNLHCFGCKVLLTTTGLHMYTGVGTTNIYVY